jgi:hypothetical protein
MHDTFGLTRPADAPTLAALYARICANPASPARSENP